MLEWISQERAAISFFVIIFLFILFFISIYLGIRKGNTLDKENVFGDPERTKGGWYWAICGISGSPNKFS